MCAVEKLPVKEMGGYKLGGHVIPQCLVMNRTPIKLQLPGKSRLIFEFYSVTAKHTAHCTHAKIVSTESIDGNNNLLSLSLKTAKHVQQNCS